MAASRSSRVTRSSVGINGLDENFCGRTLRNRSIAQPEEASPAPAPPRARSPKKRPDSQPASSSSSSQSGGQQGKVAESKAASPEGAEPWAGPRKRGLSCSEAGGEKAGARDASPPLLKRAKRCPRPGEPQGHEDEASPTPDGPAPAPATLKENNKDESQNSAASSSPRLSKEDHEEEEEDGGGESEGVALPQNAHKASNGLGENGGGDGDKDAQTGSLAGEPCADPSSPPAAASTTTASPALLNGGQTGAPSSPEPIVPCRNSVPEQAEVVGASGEDPASPPPPAASQDPAPEGPAPQSPAPELLVVREAGLEEAEVDVVGDSVCLAHEEQLREEEVVSTNGRPLTPVQDSAPPSSPSSSSTSTFINNTNDSFVVNNNVSNSSGNISGEAPPLVPAPCPDPSEPAPAPSEPAPAPPASGTPPSFTEPQEHRYTLRTSPRRAAGGGGGGAPKPGCSPPRNNGAASGSLGTAEEEGVELEAHAGQEEEPAPSDPCGDQRASADPGARAGGGVSSAAGSREARVGKEEPAGGRAAGEEEEEEEDEEEEEPDVYYFESDHLALKHNKDYQRLLQTIGVLEAQRTQAILDLEQLARRQREALSHPISFVEQLQKQVELGLPCPQRVVQLPDIPWGQYTSGLGDLEREVCDKKRKTRRLKLIFDKVGLPVRPKSPLEPKKEGESSTMYSALPSSDAPENSRQTQMIRGRLCHQSKPDTFNQLWTVEEQKKLEQLLLKFPPEEVESKRWQKIADELGNRTAKQVASRVQKYFIKLTKAGIPVPGRTPNMCMYSKKASSKRQHHLNKHLYRQSTFLTSYEPPVYMDEEDERSSFFNSLQDQSADDSDEEGVPLEYRHLPEYKELQELKRLRRRRLQELQDHGAAGEAQHLGYKCDVCGVEPIQGARWHCQDCPPDNALDFCTNCSDCLFQTETHKPGHHLEPIYHAEEAFLDRDYCLPQTTGYNYLDPNYFPANR